MPGSQTPNTPRRRMSSADRRRRIIDSAREVFVEHGLSGARTREIADRSGVTEAFLYRHFESKDEMFAVAVLDPLRDGVNRLRDDIQALYEKDHDPVSFVRQVHERCLTFNAEFAVLYSIALFAEISNGKAFFAEALSDNLDSVAEMISDRAGWTARGIDPKLVRRVFLGASWVIALDANSRGRSVDIAAVTPELAKLFIGGIRQAK